MRLGLAWIGRQGRFFLIAGLIAGLLLPEVAEVISPWIGVLIAWLLVVTGARVGASAAFGSLDALAPLGRRILLLQTALPLVVALLFAAIGVMETPLALAVVLMLSAPSLTGAPSFAIMIGQDPAPNTALLVLGTGLFPLTALPVLIFVDPTGGGSIDALGLSAGLLAAIMASVALGFATRAVLPSLGAPEAQAALDGLAALLLAVVVIGLMSAIGPLLRADPIVLVQWIAVVLVLNIALVLGTLWLSKRLGWALPLPTAIYAGNRNIALFLIVLPPQVAAPLMIFVGCYQIPMYLTPILLSRITDAAPRRGRAP